MNKSSIIIIEENTDSEIKISIRRKIKCLKEAEKDF